uniref:Uncharacterized protein n=1 Tax=Anguilla anguilla TaxID=7936 RepID=A0A0E9USD0_ANGAN
MNASLCCSFIFVIGSV